jgi:hypothetical protein
MASATNRTEKDCFNKNFTVGSVVSVRCIVTAITPAPTAPNNTALQYGGSGDLVTCQVEVNGNPGEVTPGPIFQVSPIQCRYTGSAEQL